MSLSCSTVSDSSVGRSVVGSLRWIAKGSIAAFCRRFEALGLVLAAASIAGSFFGAETSRGSLGVWGVLAMVTFALCVGSAIWVLLPHAFVFAFRGETLLAESDHRGVSDVVEAYRTAGIWVQPHLEANRGKIAGLSDCLAASCALLAVEVILWTLSLIG
jgi:hypothetical protein